MASYFADHGVDHDEDTARPSGEADQRDLLMQLAALRQMQAMGADVSPEDEAALIAAIQSLARGGHEGAPPASAAAVKALPRHKAVRRSIDPCSVCLMHIEEGQTALSLHCRHVFHEECAVSWLERHCTCPMCRTALPTDDPEWNEDEARRRIERRLEAQERATRDSRTEDERRRETISSMFM